MKIGCRFVTGAFCVLMGWLVFASRCAAAPPPNDSCAGALVIPGGGPFPYFTPTQDMKDATTTGDPIQMPECFPGSVFSSVWYRFAPATSGVYTVSLKDTAGDVWDTVLGVYTSPNTCAEPYQLANCNDDSGLGEQVLRSALTQFFNAGTTYYLVVWSTTTLTNPPAVGGTLVQLQVQKPEIPANDLCTGAEIIPSAGPFPYVTSVQDTYLATTNNDPPLPSCRGTNVPARSVWYRFNPAQSGAYYFSTGTNVSQTRVVDTVATVYSASAGCGSTFTEIGCSENGSFAASVRASLTAGADYYIVVWDEYPEVQSGETAMQLHVIREGAPLVTTLAASSLTATGAVFNGQANPRGLSTRGYFQYGTDTNLTSTTSPQAILGNGTGDVPFSKVVTGLTPGNTYYYRAVGTNSLGIRFGDILSFTLPLPRPVVTGWGMRANGFRLEFTGSAGHEHRVLGSDDLTSWTDLGAATVVSGNVFEFVDTEAAQKLYRFYRIKL